MWEWFSDLPAILVAIIIMVIIAGVVMLLWYIGFERPVQDAKRAAIKHSHAYVEAARSRLLKYAEEYRAAGVQILQYEAAQKSKGEDYSDIIVGLRSQQNALMQQLREEAQRLGNPDEVPDSVKELLDQRKDWQSRRIGNEDIRILHSGLFASCISCWV